LLGEGKVPKMVTSRARAAAGKTHVGRFLAGRSPRETSKRKDLFGAAEAVSFQNSPLQARKSSGRYTIGW
jgi:hypothetical protein